MAKKKIHDFYLMCFMAKKKMPDFCLMCFMAKKKLHNFCLVIHGSKKEKNKESSKISCKIRHENVQVYSISWCTLRRYRSKGASCRAMTSELISKAIQTCDNMCTDKWNKAKPAVAHENDPPIS